jgi:hypothetical protein
MQIKHIGLTCMEATTHGYLRLTSAGPKHEIFITKEEIKGSIFLVLQGINTYMLSREQKGLVAKLSSSPGY